MYTLDGVALNTSSFAFRILDPDRKGTILRASLSATERKRMAQEHQPSLCGTAFAGCVRLPRRILRPNLRDVRRGLSACDCAIPGD